METDKRAEKFQTFWGKYKFVLLVLLIGVVLLAIVLTVNMFQLNFFGLFKKEDA